MCPPQSTAAAAAAAGNAAAEQPVTLVSLLDAFLSLQTQRAQAYQRFDDGFRFYLSSNAQGPYRHLMAQLTPEFQQLSAQIIQLENQLQAISETEAAAAVRTIQDCERHKLRITLSLHSLRTALAQNKFHWQHVNASSGWGTTSSVLPHECSMCLSSTADNDVSGNGGHEPSKEDIDAALGELYQELEANTVCINDKLDELREMRADAFMEEG